MKFGNFSYLVLCIIFFLLWGVMMLYRKDLRLRMLLVSLSICLMGPIAEIWYRKDYWQPLKISGYLISIEDALFAFALGGISFGLYKVTFNFTVSSTIKYPRRIWLIFVCFIVTFSFLVIFNTLLKLNSVVVSSVAFVLISIMIWSLRPDLITVSIVSGFLHLILFFCIYQLMLIIYPDLMSRWCLKCNPSNLQIWGINIEEMFWDFSWGLVGGVLYEAILGRQIVPLKNKFYRNKNKQYLRKFSSFDKELNKIKSISLNSRYGKFMSKSTLRVLILLIPRGCSYYISKISGNNFSISYISYARLLIILSPLAIEIILSPLGLSTKGVALNWVFYYMVLTYCLLILPSFSWLYFMKISDDIDSILIENDDKKEIIRWFDSRLNLKTQITLSLLGGIFGVICLKYVAPFLSSHVKFGLASYVQVFLNAFLGFNAIYWLWHGPLFHRRLSKFPKLRLIWYSPVDTPSIVKLSRHLAISSLLSVFGMVLTLFPLFFYITITGSPEIVFTSTILFFITLSSVLFIAIFPQFWLIKLVSREKKRALSEIKNEIERIVSQSCRKKIENLELKYLLYHNIKRIPLSIFDIKNIFSYVLSIILAFFPYLMKLVVKFLHII